MKFRRDRVVFALIIVGFVAVLSRAFYVQVLQSSFLQEEGSKRQVRTLDIPAPRGVIYDRNGDLLALSTPMASVWVDAKVFYGYQQNYAQFLRVLGISETELMTLAHAQQHKRLSFIRQEPDPQVVKAIEELELPGIYLKKVDLSFHPKREDGRSAQTITVNSQSPSIWVDMEQLNGVQQAYAKLAKLLNTSRDKVKRKIERASERRFVYLQRSLEPYVAQQIEALDLYGVYIQDEYKRYYPAGEIAGHLIGFTNIDDQGQEGLELAYNDWLKGKAGQKQVIKDRAGRVIDFVKDVRPAKPGSDITLSIDKQIQFFAYRALKSVMIEHQAESASAVVLDAKTGEVLAMVSLPGYNPNDRTQLKGRAIRNRVITDLIEPGSTVKPFIVAKALDVGAITLDEKIDTSPGAIRVQGYRITDTHNHGVLTPEEVIQKSSNVGASKIALKMSAEQEWELWKAVGFSRDSGLYLPGEASGYLKPVAQWQPLDQVSASYGYGFNINLLNLAHAYLLFANQGEMMPLSLFKLDQPPEKTRVVGAQATEATLRMMEKVVAPGGTAPKAQIPGYRVAGKTGTVHKTKQGGYEQNEYVSLFAGVVPVSDPDMVMVVAINEPSRGVYYGGSVAAPVFKEVMQHALRLRNVPHDQNMEER
ncbi:penicillin-binding protein 2 [Thiomicrorhabdus sp. zzn3]|uniref:peptidoglycan D,D-transpeptidase FtsI family protein n=1 Tax=Thiomicrorhabdus sp. zzn3 TaxID=3039775 RepID=UPI002437271A|nr:penicillin-binding protein 2 [Thiomicrorhabdus sp. zzn3]MDG6778508.1 penicillin-binding protein 2 [Thiomicrorhabdus sp. zzn3]